MFQYFNITQFLTIDSITNFLQNQQFVFTFIFLFILLYIIMLQKEIETLQLKLDSTQILLDETNGSFTNEMLNSFKDLQKQLDSFNIRINAFNTRVKTMINRIVEGFNREQEQIKSKMLEKEELYDLNIKTIIELSKNQSELISYLESIGYNKDSNGQTIVEENEDVDYDQENEDVDYDSDNEYFLQEEIDSEVIRKRPRREVAPVSFRKFFSN